MGAMEGGSEEGRLAMFPVLPTTLVAGTIVDRMRFFFFPSVGAARWGALPAGCRGCLAGCGFEEGAGPPRDGKASS